MQRTKMPMHALIAGMFCASAATLISAFWMVVILLWLAEPHVLQHWYDVPIGVADLCRGTWVPAGGFGFLCGVLLRLYLSFRSAHITSNARLVAESGLVGALLSTCFPLFMLIVMGERLLPLGGWVNWKIILFSVAVGSPVSILYASVFHRSLLASGSPASCPVSSRSEARP